MVRQPDVTLPNPALVLPNPALVLPNPARVLPNPALVLSDLALVLSLPAVGIDQKPLALHYFHAGMDLALLIPAPVDDRGRRCEHVRLVHGDPGKIVGGALTGIGAVAIK